jgi:hypothetical protein
MMYRTIMLTIAALSTTQASAGDLSPSVYVAPGGVYIGSAQVYVTPPSKHGDPYAAPTYDPNYAPSGYVQRPHGYYHGVGPAYVTPPYGREPGYAPSPYGREPGYAPTLYGREPGYGPPPYAVDYAPRPPAGVPYNSRCYIDPTYGRVAYCN